MGYCPIGHPNAENNRYCGECGLPIGSDAEQPSGPSPLLQPGENGQQATQELDRSHWVTGRWIVVAAVLAALVGLGMYILRPSADERYVAALAEAGHGNAFQSDEAAVQHATGLCSGLADREEPEGSAADLLAVEHYCSHYVEDFQVLSPEELRDRDDLTALREAGLSGSFSADRAAIAHAVSICESFDGGAPPLGSEADGLAVAHFCPDYVPAFRIVEVRNVTGSFTIMDRDGIETFLMLCEGTGGYSDLNASTSVVVQNDAGEILARTSLGSGAYDWKSGSCEFTFSVELTEGEETYLVSVGRRGAIAYDWDDLVTPGRVALTIGGSSRPFGE